MNPAQVWWVCMCFCPLAFWYLDSGLIFIFFSSFFSLFFLFPTPSPPFSPACRMARSQEETSTSQPGRKRGPTRGMPSKSSLISSLSMDELRAYCQIPDDIDAVLSTVGEEYNAVFFTWVQLVARLCFLVPSLVK